MRRILASSWSRASRSLPTASSPRILNLAQRVSLKVGMLQAIRKLPQQLNQMWVVHDRFPPMDAFSRFLQIDPTLLARRGEDQTPPWGIGCGCKGEAVLGRMRLSVPEIVPS